MFLKYVIVNYFCYSLRCMPYLYYMPIISKGSNSSGAYCNLFCPFLILFPIFIYIFISFLSKCLLLKRQTLLNWLNKVARIPTQKSKRTATPQSQLEVPRFIYYVFLCYLRKKTALWLCFMICKLFHMTLEKWKLAPRCHHSKAFALSHGGCEFESRWCHSQP